MFKAGIFVLFLLCNRSERAFFAFEASSGLDLVGAAGNFV
jgi:hypothetical protein